MTKKIIDIISTGSACPPENLENACSYLVKKGFLPRTPSAFFSDHPLYVCHDEQRFLNIKEALYAEDSNLIWCLRGGCGTSRLLPNLLSLEPPKKKKTLIGFSDVTALHLFLTQHWDWKTIHGPTLNSLIANGAQTNSVISALDHLIQGETTSIDLPLTPLNEGAHLQHLLQGHLAGGNLALTQRSMGTPWQLDTSGKILFFEDVNEAPYRIAEILDHLKHASLFKNAQAVIFGQFTSENPDENYETLLKHILFDFAQEANFPVFSDLAVGHTNNNHPLQLNAPVTLTSKKGLLSLRQTITL
tara:strand:- start:972 stop:1877 length:906 start_codon:yes stop_codon:yes gene_type:complete